MDLSKYLDMYLTESREHVSLMRRALPESGAVSQESVNDLFRRAHSIKGMAASMGFDVTTHLSHELESLLNLWRKGQEATLEQGRAVLEAVDLLDSCMDAVQMEGSDAAMAPPVEAAVAKLVGLNSVISSPPQGGSPPAQAHPQTGGIKAEKPEVPYAGGPSIRVSIDSGCPLPAARLAVVFERLRADAPGCTMDPDLQTITRDGLRAALFGIPEAGRFKELARTVRGLPDVGDVTLIGAPVETAGPGGDVSLVQSLRVPAEDLDELRAQASELLNRLNQFEASLAPEERRRHRFWLESERAHLNRLFDRVLTIRLVSFETLVERLGRTAREVSGRLGRPTRFVCQGADERVDRGLLEKLLDPLVHLIRNAVDHGIEAPEERVRTGKAPEGMLTLDIHRESEALLVSLEDDGKGIDAEAIRQAAVDRGLFSPHEAALLDRAHLLDLLTTPAFSTRHEVTEVSGRGVGLDVVRSAVESLGGHLDMVSTQGAGSRFTLVIPSATTLTRVLVFGWDDGVRYGLPTSQIKHIYSLSSFPLVWSGDRRFLQAGEDLIPVLNWRPGPVGRDGAALRLIASPRDQVLLVTRVYQGERVVVMPWGSPLEMVSEWVGGALLSTGEIAYVLDGRVLVKREGEASDAHSRGV